MHDLTESLEDYIEAIAELIDADGHAHSKNIAARLNVKMPSVTGALRQLAQKGLITYSPHFPVNLTTEGRLVAESVRKRHQILKHFLAEHLGLPPEKASETACRLEHIIDEETIRRFVLFFDAIEQRSDARSLQTYLAEAVEQLDTGTTVLASLPPGECARISFFSKNIADPGRFPFIPGDLVERTGDGVIFSRKNVPVGVSDAENIWVENLSRRQGSGK